jgi:hypothetical protein
MAHGIQHVQAAQFLELPSSSARGIPELRNKKCLNPKHVVQGFGADQLLMA